MTIQAEHDAHTSKQGTKSEMIALLQELAAGWEHLGRPGRAVAAEEAITCLDTGSLSVRVGATTYSVVTEP